MEDFELNDEQIESIVKNLSIDLDIKKNMTYTEAIFTVKLKYKDKVISEAHDYLFM